MITRTRNGQGRPWRNQTSASPTLARIAAESVWDRSIAVVSQHPCRSLVAALTTGMVLGWIIKRL